tara:strand:- start:645 stop:1652 length:1008 start_codon:yes stop_codon:yes gene_type:complete
MRNYDITEDRANEIRAQIEKRQQDAASKLTSYYQSEKLLSLGDFDLNTALKSDIDFSVKTNDDIKALFSKTLNNGIHGLCFSPYEEGQNIGDQLSEAQIRRRMQVVSPYTKWVRSFSCTDGNEYIPKVAHEMGLKTVAGAWIDGDKAKNEKEISALIDLAQKGYVDIAVVGNEVLLRNELTEQEMLDYINRVKQALPDIPVGYVDAYYQFHERPKLVEACDIILANCYPYWEGFSIEQASIYLKQMYAVTKHAAQDKPIIITETGWPNQGDSKSNAEPSQENAMRYFINATNWSKQENIELFYFSSFDESWKAHHEGDVGQRWGIWDKNEKLKYN